MVKAIPGKRLNPTRKRKRFENICRSKSESLYNFSLSSSKIQNPVFRKLQSTAVNSIPKTLENNQFPVTSASFKKQRFIRSPSFASSTYATCSSSCPDSPSTSISSPSFLPFFGRTLSGPIKFVLDSTPKEETDSTAKEYTYFKSMRMIKQETDSSPSVIRNLMNQFPPLPPKPSPKLLLRRTVSDPVPYLSDTKKEDEKVKMKEESVKVEKVSGESVLIKLKCGCGSDSLLLFNYTDNKCYRLK
ncbi:unnamed protein product [Amaranthus hypochondriacus]